MSWKGIFGGIMTFVNDAIIGMMDTMQEHFEKFLEKAVPRVVKVTVLFLLLILGAVFILVGLANYLQATFQLTNGSGQLIVGAGLLLLGLVVKALK